MTWLWLILGAAMALGVMYWLAQRKKRKASPKSLWKRLVGLTHDASVAQRLVSKERERHPELSELALLRKVLRRLESDRR